jgi:hypothetical protein
MKKRRKRKKIRKRKGEVRNCQESSKSIVRSFGQTLENLIFNKGVYLCHWKGHLISPLLLISELYNFLLYQRKIGSVTC